NAGIRLARAPLIAFLDADDLWLPRKLERQTALFRADAGLGVVHTRRRVIDPDGWELEYREPPLPRGHVLEAMFRTNFVCFSSVVVRRQVFERVGLFDERIPLAIDYDLWLRAARHFRFDHVPEPLVCYRLGHANLSQRGEERLLTALAIMRRFLDEPGGRRLLPAEVVRAAWAETWYHLGVVRRQRSRLAALPCFLRTLALAPGYVPAWRGLAYVGVPSSLWRGLRHRLGR